jgi:hypothetical protein
VQECFKVSLVHRLIRYGNKLTGNANKLENGQMGLPFRVAIAIAIFGQSLNLPMFAVSNNALKRFFGVLKYKILNGLSSLTISAFIQLWIVYQSKSLTNAIATGISVSELHHESERIEKG